MGSNYLFDPSFPHQARHFHTENLCGPLVFRRGRSILFLNGREIFQKKRAVLDHRESWRRDSFQATESRCNWKSSCSVWEREGAGNAGFRQQFQRVRDDNAVIWKPNQIFEKSGREGASSREEASSRFFYSRRRRAVSLFYRSRTETQAPGRAAGGITGSPHAFSSAAYLAAGNCTNSGF